MAVVRLCIPATPNFLGIELPARAQILFLQQYSPLLVISSSGLVTHCGRVLIVGTRGQQYIPTQAHACTHTSHLFTGIALNLFPYQNSLPNQRGSPSYLALRERQGGQDP